ncbi:SUMF1/EgtB/PvdO family nonheme iron enzyme [Marinobacter sp.]|uniref:formylglycine-generating enzyme family protein n=1 Tax=Marinobacter sp. TaxID=50741 RepID=UPI000C4A30D1|nr:SUMF1/EgtB/PvdO family nonheme iron enzyme [Marinobacter sp.]MBE96304.1 hypothetical protein [Marinobacter sp.]MBL84640.1 hypothetical protein [Marinobacter sp.]|tara:strand:+ start:3117 stop:4073 length:957 start_codon:yes stop_codon:yes gene_type:complete
MIPKCRDQFFVIVGVLFLSACGNHAGYPNAESLDRLASKSVANQVFVKGGTFEIGDVGQKETGTPHVTWNQYSRPAKAVKLAGYSISKYETTWGEFMLYLKETGHLDRYDDRPSQRRYAQVSDDPLSPYFRQKPARAPNFAEAEGYCDWLGKQTGLPFALPTEAQWEFAARSRGQNIPYATDTGLVEKDPYLRPPREYIDPGTPPEGNALIHSSATFERRSVGSYPPNPLGLYDMTGNVAEWTRDWFQEDYYEHIAMNNPSGPEQPVGSHTPEKTVRDWAGHGEYMAGAGTVFFRSGEPIDGGGNGFRCVVNSPEPIN